MSEKILVVHDTDGHGILSGAITFKVLSNLGYDVIMAGQFARQGASTTPYGITEFLRSVITPTSLKSQGFSQMIMLDIPIPVQEPSRFIETLSEYVKMGIRILYIDHHGHSEYHRLMLEKGIVPVITPTSYELSMYIPKLYNVVNEEIEQLALIGALFDYDSSIANKVSSELEEYIERLDQWLKGSAKRLPLEQYSRHIGTEGRLAVFIADQRCAYLLNLAKTLPEIPLVQYRVISDVVLATQFPQIGLAWKTASKLCRTTGSKVAVVPTQTPRGYSVIVARYWRTPEEIIPIIEDVVKEYSVGRTVVGHLGARSIFVTSENEAFQLAEQIARELARRISTTLYTPKVTRLINEKIVARALHEDFKALLQKMTEILEEQRKMYQEYLELKRKQVELLERLREERAD